ncbi:hypothetical protein GA0111570_10296 [Raineyella antarctica]|uniref:DUF4157 domain-containing protein n=1 Tax=Raineyella antarctica TaxID=1577474 RepID=A0A1G6GE78_9ACTN|nr:hypothetical protein [Raineyella antarctica]SDB80308.1 hypothetical protein GA0111570_10296 [Raineyella antarctica]
MHPSRRLASLQPGGHTPATRLRTAVNWLNLSTPFGLGVAALGGARTVRGPRGLWLAEGYRPGFPRAGAFTVGSVVLTPGRFADLARSRPDLLAHEERHSRQWCALGLPFLPAYVAATAWSWLRTGHLAYANVFEVRAGLVSGGYRPGPGVSDPAADGRSAPAGGGRAPGAAA